MNNPVDWYNHSLKYAVENKYPIEYGCVFLIKENAPVAVVEEYKKYLKLIKKVFFSMGIGVFKIIDNHYILVGIKEDATGFEKEQYDIFHKLIEDGLISNEPFIN